MFNKLYIASKEAKVGETIKCANCEKPFVKTQWAQVFCCPACKDNYWNKKGDRHKAGYYHKYNQEHPERLDRGFTKGYNNGNVSDGLKENTNSIYYRDSLGRLRSRDFFNPTLTDLLIEKNNSMIYSNNEGDVNICDLIEDDF